MKKIIILIATLCVFSFSSDLIVVNGVIYAKSSVEYSVEDSVWTLFGGASGSCGNKINGKTYYDYDYNSETREIVVWRSCEGTLLFKGKVTSSTDGSLVENVSKPSSDFDGFCYDKNGMNPIKHVNQFTKCR
jgi:hypothetical protein